MTRLGSTSVRDAFLLAPEVVHLNHGSFGAVPRVVLEAQHAMLRRAEANPMRFLRVERPELTAAARAEAAEFLGLGRDGSDAAGLALVRNVTEAVATVLSSLTGSGRLGPGDVVLSGDSGYHAVEAAIDVWCGRTGARHLSVQLPVGLDPDGVVDAYAEALAAVSAHGERPALLVADEVVSATGATLPADRLTRLARLARAAGAVTLIDAAHAPGHLPTRPSDVGADFWAGTLHKWAFAVRGTSVLWVGESERERLQPLTTSLQHALPFPRNLDLTGTDDRSGWWCLPTALACWRDLGGAARLEQATALLDDAADLLAPVLRSDAGPTLPAPCLRLLALPDGVGATAEAADRLYRDLSARRVEAQVVHHESRGWIRLSAAPYNELADYERLADVLGDVLGGALSKANSSTTS